MCVCWGVACVHECSCLYRESTGSSGVGVTVGTGCWELNLGRLQELHLNHRASLQSSVFHFTWTYYSLPIFLLRVLGCCQFFLSLNKMVIYVWSFLVIELLHQFLLEYVK